MLIGKGLIGYLLGIFDQRTTCHECDSLRQLIEVIDRAFVSFGLHQPEAKAAFFEMGFADRSSK